jgi:hypothetical protein
MNIGLGLAINRLSRALTVDPASIEDLIVWIDPESNAGTDIQAQAESVMSEDGLAWIDPESNAGTDLKAQAESVLSENGVAWIDAESNT